MVNFMTEYVGEKKAWSIVYGIFGVIAAILFFLCFAGCKERIHENEEEKTEKIRVIDGVKAVLKNKYWHMLMVISICINIFFQAISTVNTRLLAKITRLMISSCTIIGVPRMMVV